jgi:type IV secretion system protein VirD4
MPMASRSTGGADNEAVSENMDHVRDKVEQPPSRADGMVKKSSAAVQAVAAEEQRQIEMNFVGPLSATEPTKEADEEQVKTAVDGLDALETSLKQSL